MSGASLPVKSANAIEVMSWYSGLKCQGLSMSPSSLESGHGSEQLGGGAGGVERPQSTAAAGLLQLISEPMHKETPEEHEKKSGELFQV